MQTFYISTAIAYAAAKPRIGSTYEAVLADSIARFKRLQGYDVYFQTGVDEHGFIIQQKARTAGVAPQQYVDNVSKQIRAIWDMMNISYDRFIRTTDEEHVEKVQQLFRRLFHQGDIYKDVYRGKYCTSCESFLSASHVVGEKCPNCGHQVIDSEEPAYFFKVGKYADALMKHIETHPDFIQPESRKNEIIYSYIKPGLPDLCVSRSTIAWGVPVDFDEKHVVYVWLDSLLNYISFCGYSPTGEHSAHYKKYWPADIQLNGKDIIRFHAVYWPIILLALGEPLPKKIFGHPWLLVHNQDSKELETMTNTQGNVVYAEDLVDLFGVDPVRYYLLHEMPFATDGVLSYRLLIKRINADLVNILGNLVMRTISMVQKYFDGKVMSPSVDDALDHELKSIALAMPKKVAQKMDALKVADAIDEIFTLLRRANKYIDETTPWILASNPAMSDRLGTVLYNLLESIRFSAVMLSPFLPETSARILKNLQTENGGIDSLCVFGGMQTGTVVGPAEKLFERIDLDNSSKKQRAFKEWKKQKEASQTEGTAQSGE